jgi:IPT/TIG domain
LPFKYIIMKKYFNIKWLLLAGVVMAATLNACEKDDVSEPQIVQLLSFGPTGAMHGDTLRFIGTLLDQISEIQLTGATVPKASFISQTSEEIRIIIPESTQKGFVTLKTPDLEIVSKTILDLSVVPTITSMTKEARPGSNITIKGNHLDWITSVTFAKDIVDSTFVSQNISELVVTVPDNAETGKLIFSSGGTDPVTFESDSTLIVTLPVATSFSPNPVKHQTNLTIIGTNMDLVKKVSLPGVSSAITTFVSQSATQVVVKVPSETVSGKVTLYPASNVPSVSATTMNITYPAITDMTPNPVAIGSNLTITGTNLDIAKSVSFQGVATPVTSFVSQSATSLVVVVPTGSINGKITLGIINTNQTVLSASALNIVGYVVPGGPTYPIFDDVIKWSGWIGGGWGGNYDGANGSPVKRGTASLRISYVGQWGVPLQLGGANISLAPYTTFTLAIYGATGSNGKTINIGFNEADGKTVTIVEGAWTVFDIPLSQIPSDGTLRYLYLKNYSPPGDYTIYVDDMGLN